MTGYGTSATLTGFNVRFRPFSEIGVWPAYVAFSDIHKAPFDVRFIALLDIGASPAHVTE
jgi:hypothetical protein